MSDLSEQQLMDCGKGHRWSWYGANGCDGAWAEAYFDFALTQQNGTVEMESCAPYNATEKECVDQADCVYRAAKLDNWVRYTGGDDEEMKALGRSESLCH